MKPYVDVCNRILTEGVWKENRTGIRTLTITGAYAEYDCSQGYYPLLTLKKVPFKSVIGELVGFLKGVKSAADFRALGCNVWNQNANENAQWLANAFREGEDDLGPVYGAQWRKWPAYKRLNRMDRKYGEKHKHVLDLGYRQISGEKDWQDQSDDIYYKEIDQLYECYKKIMTNPDDRRIIMHAWNPAVLDEIALPACHLLYQFIANKETKTLDLVMYQRSCDTFLGIPYNVASASALIFFMAKLTGYNPGKFVHQMADVHIYENHLPQVEEMLTREDKLLPSLFVTIPQLDGFDGNVEIIHQGGLYLSQPQFDDFIDRLTPEHFDLVDYDPHPALKAPMAV